VPPFTIRPARPEDANLLAEVHVDSIRTLGAAAYSAEIVREWGAPRTGERYLKGMESGQRWFLAVQFISDGSERALGLSAYSMKAGQHRIAVFVRGEAARRGIGTALFLVAEDAAREHGASEIHLDASLGAVPFYKSLGFEELGLGQHQLSTGGWMPAVFMRKRLS
jgi:GNAT superfamily N-acetyltransferase